MKGIMIGFSHSSSGRSNFGTQILRLKQEAKIKIQQASIKANQSGQDYSVVTQNWLKNYTPTKWGTK